MVVAGIKIAGRNINNLRYADDTTLMVENKEDLERLLKKVKEESEKAGLKLNIHANGMPDFSVHGDSSGKNIGVGCHALLQGIFPTEGLNSGLPHCR